MEQIDNGIRKEPKRKQKKNLILSLLFTSIFLLAVIWLFSYFYDSYRLQVLKNSMPQGVLAVTADNTIFYPAATLNYMEPDEFTEFTITDDGAGINEFNSGKYEYLASDNIRNIIFFSGKDQGSFMENIQHYQNVFYITLGTRELTYNEIVSEEGYFGKYHAAYSAGRLKIGHNRGTELYVLNYRIYLNNVLGNVYFTAYTTDVNYIQDAKTLLDFATKYMTDSQRAQNNIDNGVSESAVINNEQGSPMDAGFVAKEDAQALEITEPEYLANGDVTWKQDGVTIIKSTNYDYAINLDCVYDCLHVSYIYMDIAQVPDSIMLISPDGTTYQPTMVEQYKGEVTFLVEQAQIGEWTLSVRHHTSLGGSDVQFMEQSKWEELNPLLYDDIE